MPNDCFNSFTITDITHDQWRDLAATFHAGKVDEQQGFLNTFYPEPDFSVTPVARTYPGLIAKFAKTKDEREQILRNEPTIREDSCATGVFRTVVPSGMCTPAAMTGRMNNPLLSSVLVSALLGHP